METIRRIFTPPNSSFFLFGPRGTGKSTFVRHAFPHALRVDLLDAEQARSLAARPERLRELIQGRPEARPVVLDEIQRVPELLPVVHSLIESERGLQVILTGSSARKLKRTGADLLGGRALLRSMHPFLASELGKRFDLDRALREGLLPIVWSASSPRETLRAYAALYLREEVQAEGLVRNIGNFARFLEAVSFSHASLLNISAVARECEVERKVVEGYLSVLQDLLLGWRLPIFSKQARRALVAHSKFYLFDAGVFRSLRPSGPLDRPEVAEGQAVEGLVAQHLKAWVDYGHGDHTMYFWRTRSGVEVDFVIYGPDGIWAIEVKHGRKIHPGDLRGLKAFREDYPASRPILVYRGGERLSMDGIQCLPMEGFLCGLRPGEPLA
jgi:predicted AAA+ superfamily ATPase